MQANMQRAKKFTTSEKNDLLDIIFLYCHVLENKVTDNITNLKKDEAWTNITIEYNKNRTTIRSEKNLRLCWDNIKRDTRKYYATLKRETYKTGGGVLTLEKNPIFERAKEILGDTTVSGLANPFDSDYVDTIGTVDNKLQENTVIDLQDEDNENDPQEIFSYLVENKEINEWKSWNIKKLKSQKSFPLQDQHSATTSKNVKKIKLENNTEILYEAKLKLLHTLQTNEKEKKDYEIDLLKAKLEKEKL
ncbi:PREDICTED: uncharacterized protein LOC108757379 [Trachymyrmex cornetzi]|uniref:uncharacterized protein LOC108757379 n=1 Tax=Trachymyrmex cornetzi TaxID=471704 RepID=UPI00084F5652|nr:PREDICTED: uncharacterized protein LOC108757379 [Trachymyrmex cornetzi]